MINYLIERIKGTLDLIIITAFGNEPLDETLLLLSPLGTAVALGLPDHNVTLGLSSIVYGSRCLTGSLIGSISEVQDMLQFSSKHGVRPWVNVIPMEKVNEAIKLMKDGKAKYRIVLEKMDSSFDRSPVSKKLKK